MTVTEPGLEIEHVKQFAGCCIEPLALQVMADLIAKGWTTHSSLYWDDHAAILKVDGEPRAFIVWRVHQLGRSAFITLGATLPNWRRQGLYSRLFAAFAADLRKHHPELRRIESGYHVDNEASAAMQAALGRKVTWHMTLFDLQAAANG